MFQTLYTTGNLGVGTSSTSYKLHVSGTMGSYFNSAWKLRLTGSNTGSNADTFISWTYSTRGYWHRLVDNDNYEIEHYTDGSNGGIKLKIYDESSSIINNFTDNIDAL